MRASRMVLTLAAIFAAGWVVVHAAAGPQTKRDRAVPILMYHVIAERPTGAPNPSLFVPQSEFAAQMAWLESRGYRAVTLDRVWAAWHGGAALPMKPVVLTFDDGSASIPRNALPVLRKLRWPGVLNLKLGNVRPRGGITAAQVTRLIRAGWEVDSHTISHPDLTTLSAGALKHEIAGSRWTLQRRFGVPARFFCYPAGRYDARVIAAVRAAGYLGATTTRHGLAGSSAPFELARIRVNGGDGARGLRRTLVALGG